MKWLLSVALMLSCNLVLGQTQSQIDSQNAANSARTAAESVAYNANIMYDSVVAAAGFALEARYAAVNYREASNEDCAIGDAYLHSGDNSLNTGLYRLQEGDGYYDEADVYFVEAEINWATGEYETAAYYYDLAEAAWYSSGDSAYNYYNSTYTTWYPLAISSYNNARSFYEGLNNY